MQTSATPTALDEVRSFIQEYFDAWKGTDEQEILTYYSENVVLDLPMETLKGKTAVRDNFVRPFVAGFPGNVQTLFGVNGEVRSKKV